MIARDLGSTPAGVHPSSGVLYINDQLWNTLDQAERFFVLLHENAHIQGQTRSEYEADRIAFEEYARRGYSLRSAVYALTKLLPFTSPEHYERATRQLERAIAFQKTLPMCATNSNCGCGCTSQPVYTTQGATGAALPAIAVGEPYLAGPYPQPYQTVSYPAQQSLCWFDKPRAKQNGVLNLTGEDGQPVATTVGWFNPAPGNTVPSTYYGPTSTSADKKWWQSAEGISALGSLLAGLGVGIGAATGQNQQQQQQQQPVSTGVPWYVWALVGVVAVAIVVYAVSKK